MKRIYFLPAFIFLAALAGCSHSTETVPNAPQTNAVPAAAPQSPNDAPAAEPIESTLTLTGIVQSGVRAALTTRQPAKIIYVGVKQGDMAAAGGLLVRLDDAEAAAQERTANAGVVAAVAQVRKAQAGRDAQATKADSDIAAAQSGVEQARLKWEQAKSGVAAARSQDAAEQKLAAGGVRKAELGREQAQKTLHSLEELAKVGGISRNDLEGARTQVQVAQSDLDAAKVQAAQGRTADGIAFRVANAVQDAQAAKAGLTQAAAGLSAARKAKADVLRVAAQDIRAAQAAVTQAQAGVSAARAAREMFRLVSPIGGTVSDVAARVGETAQPGVPLVTVVSLYSLRVEALVTARQLGRLHIGQAAQIRVDTQPGKIFLAAVSEIARSAEADGRTFRAQFRFRENVFLRPGQTARITLPDVK